MLRNRIYIGHIESPEIAVSARGDFEPLIDEATFYRAQAVLDGRVPVATPRQRNHPDFPLRGFVRCETCGRPLTGSWSRGGTAATRTTTARAVAGPSTSARLQELFFPEGIAFDGIRFNRTAVTALLFRYLEPSNGPNQIRRAKLETNEIFLARPSPSG